MSVLDRFWPKDKYGVSVYKLIHISIKNALNEYHKENDTNK